MLNIDDALFDKRVAVGVENFRHPIKLFWYYGILTDINDTGIVLKCDKEMRIIPHKDIRAIHEERRGWYNA